MQVSQIDYAAMQHQKKQLTWHKLRRRYFAEYLYLLYYYPNLGKSLDRMTDCLLVMTSLPDKAIAKGIAHRLLDQKLTACISIIPAMTQATHPCNLPEIIATEITQGLPDYLGWIKESTQE